MKKLIIKLTLVLGVVAIAFTACQKTTNPDCPNLQLNYGDTCIASGGTLGTLSRLGLVDSNCNCDSTLFTMPTPTFDCPSLQQNYGDGCTLGGVNGVIDNNCNCDTTTVQAPNWDCVNLQLNIGDTCRTLGTSAGIVDSNCNCN